MQGVADPLDSDADPNQRTRAYVAEARWNRYTIDAAARELHFGKVSFHVVLFLPEYLQASPSPSSHCRYGMSRYLVRVCAAQQVATASTRSKGCRSDHTVRTVIYDP